VLVDPVVPEVDVVLVEVEVVAVFVTGGPPPVSVAVVPVVLVVVGWRVSVAARSSVGPRLHAAQSAMIPIITMTRRMRMVNPSAAMPSNRRARLARDVNGFAPEVQYG
jgi:hypothetical protein